MSQKAFSDETQNFGTHDQRNLKNPSPDDQEAVSKMDPF